MMRFGIKAANICLVLTLAPLGAAWAADADPDNGNFTALFDGLIRNPASVDINLRYAEAAAQRGDLEAAITALERLLFYDPTDARIRLQLGLLYGQLGSYDVAQTYLKPLADNDATPEPVRSQAADGLATIAGASSPHQLHGLAFFGLQYQTNPAAAAGSPVFVTTGTSPATVNTKLAGHSDTNVIGQGAATYSYDLGTNDNDEIEITGQGYVARYVKQLALNTVQGQLTAGPRLGLGRIGWAGATVRPYMIADYVQLAGAPYYRGYGAGVELDQKLVTGDELTAGIGTEQANYHASQSFPAVRALNGRIDRYSIGYSHVINEALTLGVSGSYARQNTRVGYFNNNDYAVNVTGGYAYRPGFGPSDNPWHTVLGVTGHYIAFDAQDPSIKLGSKQTDWRWQFSLTEIVPITDTIAFSAQVSRDILSSNITNYAYHNLSFIVGPQISF
jgi:hypothetical protein